MTEINYLADVQPYEAISGIDDDGIAAILSGLTHRAIAVRAAKQYFRRGLPADPSEPLWRRESPTSYSGKLEDAANKADNPPAILAGLRDIWAALFDDSAEDCGTTTATYAPAIKGVVDYLVGTNQITKAECDAFYALGGGLKFPAGVTAADVATARTAHQAEEAAIAAQQAISDAVQALENEYTRLYNENIAPLIGNQNTNAADWRAALQAMTNAFGS